MQQLIERGWIDAQDGFVLCDQTFAGHIDGDLQRRFRSAFAVARLQHVELTAFDGELDVLHVAIMGFELFVDVDQLGEHLRHRLFQRLTRLFHLDARGFGERLWRADAGDDVFALRVYEIFAVEFLIAGAGVARKGDARGGGLAHIAEHHGLDVDGRAPAFGDVVVLAIEDRAIVHPA